MTKYIFITGGVVSSLGIVIVTSSLASLLKLSKFNLRIRKLDPYLNIDPGTMNPAQHGEVFVTDDGAETDMDLGHYERFTGIISKKIASTLSSIGVPSFYVDAGSCSHGDLGMISSGDMIILISHSGESTELKNIIQYTKRIFNNLFSE